MGHMLSRLLFQLGAQHGELRIVIFIYFPCLRLMLRLTIPGCPLVLRLCAVMRELTKEDIETSERGGGREETKRVEERVESSRVESSRVERVESRHAKTSQAKPGHARSRQVTNEVYTIVSTLVGSSPCTCICLYASSFASIADACVTSMWESLVELSRSVLSSWRWIS